MLNVHTPGKQVYFLFSAHRALDQKTIPLKKGNKFVHGQCYYLVCRHFRRTSA